MLSDNAVLFARMTPEVRCILAVCELSRLPGTRARKTEALRDKNRNKQGNAFLYKTGTQINKPR